MDERGISSCPQHSFCNSPPGMTDECDMRYKRCPIEVSKQSLQCPIRRRCEFLTLLSRKKRLIDRGVHASTFCDERDKRGQILWHQFYAFFQGNRGSSLSYFLKGINPVKQLSNFLRKAILFGFFTRGEFASVWISAWNEGLDGSFFSARWQVRSKVLSCARSCFV